MAPCRHDNDHSNIQDISIAPTQQEVLCQVAPYLPPNQPGTVLHLEQGSPEAHKDLHFRFATACLPKTERVYRFSKLMRPPVQY